MDNANIVIIFIYCNCFSTILINEEIMKSHVSELQHFQADTGGGGEVGTWISKTMDWRQ